MRAWRVHDHGEPAEVFRLDHIDPPTPNDLAGLGMGLSGWTPLQPGAEPFTDWVIMDVTAAARRITGRVVVRLGAER